MSSSSTDVLHSALLYGPLNLILSPLPSSSVKIYSVKPLFTYLNWSYSTYLKEPLEITARNGIVPTPINMCPIAGLIETRDFSNLAIRVCPIIQRDLYRLCVFETHADIVVDKSRLSVFQVCWEGIFLLESNRDSRNAVKYVQVFVDDVLSIRPIYGGYLAGINQDLNYTFCRLVL